MSYGNYGSGRYGSSSGYSSYGSGTRRSNNSYTPSSSGSSSYTRRSSGGPYGLLTSKSSSYLSPSSSPRSSFSTSLPLSSNISTSPRNSRSYDVPSYKSTYKPLLDTDKRSPDLGGYNLTTSKSSSSIGSDYSDCSSLSGSISEKNRNRYGSSNYPETSSDGSHRYSSLSCSKSSLNDENEKDYKKLYEELQKEIDRLREVEKENERLKETLKKTEEELERTKKQLKKVNETSNMRNAVTEAERKSMRALERKVAEMEEEVKLVEKLRSDNERLRAENGALVRVIGKVSKNKEWIASSESASAEVQ